MAWLSFLRVQRSRLCPAAVISLVNGALSVTRYHLGFFAMSGSWTASTGLDSGFERANAADEAAFVTAEEAPADQAHAAVVPVFVQIVLGPVMGIVWGLVEGLDLHGCLPHLDKIS